MISHIFDLSTSMTFYDFFLSWIGWYYKYIIFLFSFCIFFYISFPLLSWLIDCETVTMQLSDNRYRRWIHNFFHGIWACNHIETILKISTNDHSATGYYIRQDFAAKICDLGSNKGLDDEIHKYFLNIRFIAKMYVCVLHVIKGEHSLNVLRKNIYN